MSSLRERFELTPEEEQEIMMFSRELDTITRAPARAMSETEISKIESSLNDIIQEISRSVIDKTDKINA